MTDASQVDPPATVKRRQYLLLAGIGAAIGGAALLSVTLTGTRNYNDQPAKPKSTNILAPGAQVDPRDAWRGQADAQLKGIEQRSRELAQRNAELQGQSKEMTERLKKLEQGGLTPLPPPPVAAPAVRPNFGPDRPGTDLPESGYSAIIGQSRISRIAKFSSETPIYCAVLSKGIRHGILPKCYRNSFRGLPWVARSKTQTFSRAKPAGA